MTKTRVVDIGVTDHNDDVAAIPAQLLHLRPRHWQERRRTETLGPVLAIGEKVGGSLQHETRSAGQKTAGIIAPRNLW